MDFIKKVVAVVLALEARCVLARYRPKIIAITGSIGKTSAKDATFAALEGSFYVRKSEKSLNSELGVPLTVLGRESGWKDAFRWIAIIVHGLDLLLLKRSYPEWLVIEVGADRPGDIASTARWLRPDIAVITAIPDIPAHVEYFDSADAVAREKRSLAEYIKPGGSLILNNDDERTRKMKADFRGIAMTFGREDTADIYSSHEEIIYEGGRAAGMRFRVNEGGASVPVELKGALGESRIYAALAACAVGRAAGLDLVALGKSLARYHATPGRMRIVPGIKDALIIDDTYNSSPAAALSALDTLKVVRTSGRKIAVLGDMLELGRMTAEAHRQVGIRAAESADMLITVGLRARAIAEAARDAGMDEYDILQYEMGESQRAGKELESVLQPGDVVLIKGSQGIRMEKTVKEIMAAPQYAEELLVRQDAEWQNR